MAGSVGRRTRFAVIAAAIVAAVTGVPSVASASVSSVPDSTASVSGTVYAMTRVGTRTIIGGSFTSVGGVARRNVAAIRADGTVDQTFNPSPNGTVYAVAASADGTRVFLGGTFSSAGGANRERLAAVNATTGSVISDWYAAANGEVDALVTAGNVLYVGGKFTTLGGIARRRIGAVGTMTRTVQAGFNPWADWTVRAIAVSPDRGRVYAAGAFDAIGGAARNGLAELRADTGAATAFTPADGGLGITLALAPDGSRLYFATADNRMLVFNPAVSNLRLYLWRSDGDVQAISVSTTEVYLGGHFTSLWRGATSATRTHIASISTAGTLTSWNPSAEGGLGVWTISPGPSALSIGGAFTSVGPGYQRGFARFSGTP